MPIHPRLRLEASHKHTETTGEAASVSEQEIESELASDSSEKETT